MKITLSNKNLERLGFARYVKAGDGKYERTAGGGPDVIPKDSVISDGDNDA